MANAQFLAHHEVIAARELLDRVPSTQEVLTVFTTGFMLVCIGAFMGFLAFNALSDDFMGDAKPRDYDFVLQNFGFYCFSWVLLFAGVYLMALGTN